jgi:tRNA A-37 threonylcarbamoyl transferase component Bud32
VDHQALTIGQTFAERYRVEKFLAQGGFGAVYVAEQLETELKVALKVLWPHVLHSQDAVEKFRLEARVAGRVGSEHIVKVFDAGFDSGSGMPFLVMELLHGSELDKIVETQGPLSGARVSNYFRQIASGLDKAHGYVTREGVATPIVHRDLKPENLFLADRESGEPTIKILDFGIAKVLTESTNVSQEVKGTPLYMAFEQVAAGKITRQTDIWPLGLIGFFLLTGKAYWKSANLGEATITQLFGEVLSLPIEPASVRAAELGVGHLLPPAFDGWFARCVEREPAKRFASAGECAQVLAEALGAGVAGPGASAVAVAGAATQRSAAPPVNLVGAGSSAVAAQTLGRTTGAPLVTRTGDAPKSRGGLKWLGAALGLALVGGGAVAAQRALRSPPPVPTESAAIASATAPSRVGAAPATVPILASAASSEPTAPSTSAVPSGSSAMAAGVGGANARPAPIPGIAQGRKQSAPGPIATPPAQPANGAAPGAKPAATPGKPIDLYGDR